MPTDAPESESSRPIVSRAVDWLFQQGVSTVLLCAILYAAYCAAPRIEALFDRQRSDFTNALKSQQDVFERTLDRTVAPRANAETRAIEPTPAGSAPGLEGRD